MEGIPVGFIFLLLGGFAAALIVTFVAFALKQRRVARLKNPHRDYYR